MTDSTLVYLSALRPFLTQLSANNDDPAVVASAAVFGQLLDHVVVELSVLPDLQTETMAAFSQAASELENQLDSVCEGESAKVKQLIASLTNQLKAECARADTSGFDKILALVQNLLAELLALGTGSEHIAAFTRIESDHVDRMLASAAKQSALAMQENEGAPAGDAMNARSYDEDKLLSFIVDSFPTEQRLKIEQSGFISGGFSKFTVGLSLSNADAIPAELILRGDANALYGGANVAQEYQLLKVLYEHGVNVAKPLVLEESGEIFGAPFFLMEKKPGALIGHMFNLPGRNPDLCAKIAQSLAQIHHVPIDVLGTKIANASGKNSDKVLEWLDEGFDAWKPLDTPSPVFESAFLWLRENAALNDDAVRGLVHGDYGLNNLLIHDGEVSSVLDWEFAHIGNQAYDLGYFYFMAENLDSWENFLTAYQAAGGKLPSEDHLNYNILLAATRLGVMTCQTRSSFISGEQSGLAGIAVTCGHFYEQSVSRISMFLQRVL